MDLQTEVHEDTMRGIAAYSTEYQNHRSLRAKARPHDNGRLCPMVALRALVAYPRAVTKFQVQYVIMSTTRLASEAGGINPPHPTCEN